MDHASGSIKTRGIDALRLGTIEDIPDPVELFAEEIPKEELEAGDHEVTNDFYFTRDVARTLGIPFKFVSLKATRNRAAELTKERDPPTSQRTPRKSVTHSKFYYYPRRYSTSTAEIRGCFPTDFHSLAGSAGSRTRNCEVH